MSTLKQFIISISALAMMAILFLPGTIKAQTDPNAGVAAAVQSYFSDIPVMIAVAKCESGPRQFEADGTPLFGGTGTMVGVFQIDESTHATAALALGYDINTLAGNMGYARYLYGIEGTEPWISSFGCWNNSNTGTSVASAPTSTLTLDLSLGAIDPQVLILQQMLNAAGFTLATSGPGSLGNETNKFGALTYVALKKFQCARGIACSGSEASTGYGFLNAPTRAALLATAGSGSITMAASSTASGTVVLATTPTSTTSVMVENPAEIAELQSRIAALLAIVADLQARVTAMATHA